MNKISNNSTTTKKTYRKPQLIQVRLRPEEAVLGGCNGTTVGPTGGTACASGMPAVSCNVGGS